MQRHRPRSLPLALLFLAFLSLAGCNATSQRSQTHEAAALAPANWSNAPSAAGDVSDLWIASFGDATLEALVAEAMRENFSLASASQRVRAAAALARISRSFRLPAIGANLRSSTQKSLVDPGTPVFLESDSHSLGLSAQWEIDLWNRLGQSSRSSVALLEAAQFDFEALRLSLAGQIAKSWFAAAEARAQLLLAEASAKNFDAKLASLEKRYQRGLVEAFDLRLLRAQAASARASAIGRRSQLDATLRQLETLVGRYPSAALAPLSELAPLPPLPTVGLPATLLERRPDLRAEERRLASAFALDLSARRNWLPNLALSASGGTASGDFANLLDSDFTVWSIAASLVQPLLQGGRLQAEREQTDANRLSSIANYKQLALQAFREVESSLRAEADLADLAAATEMAATESQLAEAQAWLLYERGLVDITSALDSERRSFEAQSQLLSVHNRRLQNRVDLHAALGGGFEQRQP